MSAVHVNLGESHTSLSLTLLVCVTGCRFSQLFIKHSTGCGGLLSESQALDLKEHVVQVE